MLNPLLCTFFWYALWRSHYYTKWWSVDFNLKLAEDLVETDMNSKAYVANGSSYGLFNLWW